MKKWYFGTYAALDFMTSPPTILNNSAMIANSGCGSISDAAGNLLFYTNGNTVWDQSHSTMANGTLLAGSNLAPQSGFIVKQPGANSFYYIFTQGSNALKYTIVDMSLSAGMGSVTVKNATLQTLSMERLAAVRHCNGTDVWVVSHDIGSSNFRSFLLTSAGLSTVNVTSAIGGTVNVSTHGCMKISPNGKKLGLATYYTSSYFEVYDFDNSTGVVSNSLSLAGITNAYGCEFSPDGTKFYGGDFVTNGTLYQWDLCAGSNTAIVASQTSIVTSTTAITSMQIALDGKIYVTKNGGTTLGVINNPNIYGTGCNYVDAGQSVNPNSTSSGLPGFIAGAFLPHFTTPPFTYSISTATCNTALFYSPSAPTTTIIGCSVLGYSLTNRIWDFGDPLSGATNTTTLSNPSHLFSSPGTYTVQLIQYYSCGGATDTLKQTVSIPSPSFPIGTTSITCANLGSATVSATGGVGPFSFTWTPTLQTMSVATGLIPGNYSITAKDLSGNCIYTTSVNFIPLIPLTGTLSNTSSLTCNGINSGTASINGLSGGSGSQYYLWTNGVITQTTAFANNLGASAYSVSVIDALTACTINSVFTITQPPALTLTLAGNTATSCAGTSVALTSTVQGGTPGYSYSWIGGPTSNAQTVSESVAGIYVYTLTSLDSYSCLVSNTISVNFIVNPSLTVASTSICPLQTGTLIVTGATSYTWIAPTFSLIGTQLTDNPLVTSSYSVLGSALGCTSAATASIVVKPTPIPLLNNNGPVCNGQSLQLFGNGGATYFWTGPLSFTSSGQYPIVNPAVPGNSGTYNLTVTATNNCTASTSSSITVNATPTLVASGSTVCVSQILNLSASSYTGSTFLWNGPNSFTSVIQNPTITSPSVNNSGNYTVIATSVAGCTNSAIVNVTVTAMPTPTILSNSPICNGSNLYLNGLGGLSYSWSGPIAFNSSLQSPTITNAGTSASGTYTLTITTGPCINNKTHTVIINSLPNPTITSNSPICEGRSLIFNVNGTNLVGFVWQGPNFSSIQQNPSISVAQPSNSGTYSLLVVDNNTCQNTTTISIGIFSNPTITATSATVCLNDPASLKANGANTYFWVGPGFFQSNSQNALVPIASNTQITTYSVIGTSSNSCSDTAYATLTTLSLPTAFIKAYPSARVCRSNTITLLGDGGVLYDWYGPYDFHYSGKTLQLGPNYPWQSGSYTLNVTDSNGCKNRTSTNLSVDELPQGNLVGTKNKFCIPFCSDFIFTTATTGSINIVTSWKLENKLFDSNNFSYCFSKPGAYTIQGLLRDTLTSCINTSTFLIEAYPKPSANFTYSPIPPIELKEVTFENKSNGELLQDFNWFFINNQGYTSNSENTAYTFDSPGYYPVSFIVKNSWGCSDTMIKIINVEADFNIYVPDVFTPNEDNKNDYFSPVVNGAKFYHLTIYNRKGMKLFETTDPSLGWDGSYNGAICMNDVYIWKMTVSANNGEMKELLGYVTLNK